MAVTFNNSNFGTITTNGGSSEIRTASGDGTVYISISTGVGSGSLQRSIAGGPWLNISSGDTFSLTSGQTLQFRAFVTVNTSFGWGASINLRQDTSNGTLIGLGGIDIPGSAPPYFPPFFPPYFPPFFPPSFSTTVTNLRANTPTSGTQTIDQVNVVVGGTTYTDIDQVNVVHNGTTYIVYKK